MKKLLPCLFIFISTYVFAAPGNDNCSGAVTLPTVTGNYSGTAGDLYLATTSNPGGSTCGSKYDVWYKFTVPATSTFVDITVSLTSATTSLTTANTFIELFTSGTCTPSANNGGCQDISVTRRFTGLTAGATYLFRIYETAGNPNSNASNWAFNVGVTSNDNCATSTTITPGTTLDGSVLGASNSSVTVAPCTGTADDDVWYKFTALYSYATITLGNIGSDFATSGSRLQLFSSTSPCVITSIACGTSNVINATGLTVGGTYYIRVYSAGSTQSGTNWGFQISLTPSAKVIVGSGRMNEVFHQQILSASQVLADPWEVTYGPDNNLWITESKGYRLYKMDPTTGKRDTVLDLSTGSTFLPSPSDTLNAVSMSSWNPWPQGGFAGMALHPKFLDGTGLNDYVYVAYVHRFLGGSSPTGLFYRNKLVRFTYNSGTGKLGSPVVLCDTLPGSKDHNSQRMIIAPLVAGGTNYLFYGSGDMGSGQFENRDRVNKAQNPASYEGKILRFNLVTDGDAGASAWIPNGNPYNVLLGVQSAVYSIGIRNNQGFAYDTALNVLFGSSHGPYSDDEINIIQSFKNYGHPRVIGFADGNYNGTTSASTSTSVSAGANFADNSGNSSIAPVGDEVANKNAINAGVNGQYKDPLFSAYAASNATIKNIWANNLPNADPVTGGWPSEAWSGLDLYTNTLIPGWYKSLVAASLKWGRLVRLRLGAADTTTAPSNAASDTISYFGSQNRFRDLAFSPNGKDIYVVMDRSTTTSGPSAANPVVPVCAGCVQKYTFLGYADNAGASTIPTSINVTDSIYNTCVPATTVVIDNTNNNIWVPITGPDGNIMAEIKANGNNLDTVTSSYYEKSGAIRIKNGVHYLNRNISIKPKVQPSTNVDVRLYISKAEYDALDADPLSGITVPGDLKVLKNADSCGASVVRTTALFTTTIATHGANGYVLKASIPGFSTFYFGSSNIILPLDLLSFTGSLQNNTATLLKWETEHEVNTSNFLVERSADGINYNSIGTVAAAGNNSTTRKYSFVDNDAANQQSLILYYRLKIVDIDGAFKYSPVITVSFADITGRINIAPNPVKDIAMVTIVAPEDGKLHYKLIDNAGQIITQKYLSVRKGAINNISVDMSRLAAGSYFLNITGAGINSNSKVQKL